MKYKCRIFKVLVDRYIRIDSGELFDLGKIKFCRIKKDNNYIYIPFSKHNIDLTKLRIKNIGKHETLYGGEVLINRIIIDIEDNIFNLLKNDIVLFNEIIKTKLIGV